MFIRLTARRSRLSNEAAVESFIVAPLRHKSTLHNKLERLPPIRIGCEPHHGGPAGAEYYVVSKSAPMAPLGRREALQPEVDLCGFKLRLGRPAGVLLRAPRSQ